MKSSPFAPAARVLLVLALGLGACEHDHDHDHDHNYGDGAIPDRPDGAFLCVDLGPLCHDVDPGSGPLHDCHEGGHNPQPAWCAANAQRCIDLCNAARADAGAAADVAHNHGDGGHH